MLASGKKKGSLNSLRHWPRRPRWYLRRCVRDLDQLKLAYSSERWRWRWRWRRGLCADYKPGNLWRGVSRLSRIVARKCRQSWRWKQRSAIDGDGVAHHEDRPERPATEDPALRTWDSLVVAMLHSTFESLPIVVQVEITVRQECPIPKPQAAKPSKCNLAF